jgi:prevent-host-death family protein
MGKEPEVITVTELRNMTREVIENAHFRGRQYVVERVGQPMVVIMGVEEYMCLLQIPGTVSERPFGNSCVVE